MGPMGKPYIPQTLEDLRNPKHRVWMFVFFCGGRGGGVGACIKTRIVIIVIFRNPQNRKP